MESTIARPLTLVRVLLEAAVVWAVAIFLDLVIEFRSEFPWEREARGAIGVIAAVCIMLRLCQYIRVRWRVNKFARETNVCRTCGYDLRGHAAGQSCPECGTGIPVDLREAKSIHSKP